MKFTKKDGLIWVSFALEEACILNTGSATTAIDIDLIDFNQIKTEKLHMSHCSSPA